MCVLCVCVCALVWLTVSVAHSKCGCFQAVPVQVTDSCYLMLKFWLQMRVCVCVCSSVCVSLCVLVYICGSSAKNPSILSYSCILGEILLPPRLCHSESAEGADWTLS